MKASQARRAEERLPQEPATELSWSRLEASRAWVERPPEPAATRSFAPPWQIGELFESERKLMRGGRPRG